VVKRNLETEISPKNPRGLLGKNVLYTKYADIVVGRIKDVRNFKRFFSFTSRPILCVVVCVCCVWKKRRGKVQKKYLFLCYESALEQPNHPQILNSQTLVKALSPLRSSNFLYCEIFKQGRLTNGDALGEKRGWKSVEQTARANTFVVVGAWFQHEFDLLLQHFVGGGYAD